MRIFKKKPVSRMQLANRRLWRDALMSDEYVQGRAALVNLDFEYCCLGVACDAVLGFEVVDGPYGVGFRLPPGIVNDIGGIPEGHTDVLTAMMPKAMFEATFGFAQGQGWLSAANDLGGADFMDIASMIPLNRTDVVPNVPERHRGPTDL